jgi:hypothetical protein
MPKFIIDQALALRTIVEVEADNWEKFKEKYYNGDYDDIISEAQVEQWNVEDEDPIIYNGDLDLYEYHQIGKNLTVQRS